MRNGLGLEILDIAGDDSQETLIWNRDGFCWLRGANGEHREFEGKFSSLPKALSEARKAGFEPTAVVNI